MEIWAADGHHIAHATHDPRNEKGIYNSVSAIYKLDLRSGWMRFMDLVRPTEVSLQFIRWLRAGLTRPTCYRQAIAQLRPLMLAYL